MLILDICDFTYVDNYLWYKVFQLGLLSVWTKVIKIHKWVLPLLVNFSSYVTYYINNDWNEIIMSIKENLNDFLRLKLLVSARVTQVGNFLGYSHFGDNFIMLATDWRSQWHLLDVDARHQCWEKILVTKMARTVTHIFQLSPTHFVFNTRHQHRFSWFAH